MRSGVRQSVVLLLVALAAPVLCRAEEEPLAKLKERAEAARGGHRAELFLEAARREMEAADTNFTSGDADKAHALVKDAVADVEKGADAALKSGQRLKRTEIEVRRLRHRTQEIRRSLALDDRPQLEQAEKRMDELLQALLKKVFSK